MGRKRKELKPRTCSSCGGTFTMESLGLDPDIPRHRLRFGRKTTCGASDCIKKAIGRKPAKEPAAATASKATASERTSRDAADDAMEISQHIHNLLQEFHSSTPNMFSDVDPRIVAYRRMMGRMQYA